MRINKKIKKIFMIGIGGSGMCGLAEILFSLGYDVYGSDINVDSDSVKHLKKLGIKVFKGHAPKNIGDAQVVVFSSAIKEDNPEILEAKKRGLLILRRAEMLSELMRLKFGVAIAGAHGKTTTTSMIGDILKEAGLDPTIVVGGRVKSLRASAKLGKGDIMVAEVDESDGSFLKFLPAIAVITNIDKEHLDHYGNFENLKRAFLQFANSVPFYGEVIVNGDDENIRALIERIERNTLTFGFGKGNFVRGEIVSSYKDEEVFNVFLGGEFYSTFRMKVLGVHNVMNALSSISVALYFDVDREVIKRALQNFSGVSRRFELKYDGCVKVYEDYGHHPNEIKVTLSVAKRITEGKLVVVFQPHRFTRTKFLFKEFPDTFKMADIIILLPIYPAGEEPIEGITSELLYSEFKKQGFENIILTNKKELFDVLFSVIKENDLILFQGAGDIRYLCNDFVEKLRRDDVKDSDNNY